MPRLGQLDRGRDNNLSLLRHIAASLVIFSHSFPLSGRLGDEPLARLVGILDFGTLAVLAFFAISGYLIARSFDRSEGLGDYLRSRALRILPAYAAAIAYAAFLIGPLVTTLPLAEYFAHGETWRYVAMNFTFTQHDRLPGVFVANPLPGAVNGSLWTLPVEVFCYGALALAGLVGALHRPWLAASLALALVVASESGTALSALVPHGEAVMTARLAGTFVAGSLAYAWRDRVPVSPWIAFGALAVAWMSLDTRVEGVVLVGALAYATLVLGYHPALDVPALRRRDDWSYGMYVYAFPTQQLVVWMSGTGSPWLLFALAYPATIVLAAASWRWIEAPALRFRRRESGMAQGGGERP
jgi:peptidoglycan/LPS O-acetylase OafA/YrhL